jgi:hypothetical protein
LVLFPPSAGEKSFFPELAGYPEGPSNTLSRHGLKRFLYRFSSITIQAELPFPDFAFRYPNGFKEKAEEERIYVRRTGPEWKKLSHRARGRGVGIGGAENACKVRVLN